MVHGGAHLDARGDAAEHEPPHLALEDREQRRPASTDARTTSVGTAAIARFARPLCWQDADAAVLPPELADRNARGVWRLVDDRFTRDDVGAT